MSRELFKSMTYRDGKVFTRQCSNNVYPKDYYSVENTALTKIFNELGQVGFEKWFLNNCLMQGDVEVLSSSNKTLQKLNYLAELLWKDEQYQNLYNKRDQLFMKSLSANTEEEKNNINKESIKIKEDIASYVSSFYDTYITKFRNIERSR